jgi:hypothetical protein
MFYKVREGFYPLLKNGTCLQPGAIVELSDDDVDGYLHQLEEVVIEQKSVQTSTRPRKTKAAEAE